MGAALAVFGIATSALLQRNHLMKEVAYLKEAMHGTIPQAAMGDVLPGL
jgi:hypothetical protein